MLQIDRRIFMHFDYILPLLLLPIIGLSYFLVEELQPALADKQLIYFTIGVFTFIIFFLFPIRKLLWMIPFFYWINVALLLSVKFFGLSRHGAKRWLEIPFVNFTIQPSEIMKIAFILMLAYLINHNPPDKKYGYGIVDFLKISLYILIPFVLILLQPDLGSALMYLFVGFGVLFVVGVNYKIWLTTLLLAGITAPLAYGSLHEYQKVRIKDFLSEKPSYHVRQSIIAIGSGGLTGQQQSEATQANLDFLPVAVSDFLFAYHMERFGFIGGLLLIAIYILIILYLFMLANYNKGDYLIQVVASSLALLIFLHVGVNIAMTIGYAPVVGLPLAFFSYGGSSFLTFMILVGVLENVLSFRYDTLYDSIKYG